jgi:SAM-dependent methyltransferase
VPDFDPWTPNVARVYDYTLGGKDNFPADREFAEQLFTIVPEVVDHVRVNRQFLARAVTWLAGQGVSQFIDLGPGLPTKPNTHETARAVRPDARVVYVDNDPVVVVHLDAATGGCDPELSVLNADTWKPSAIMAAPEVTGYLDLDSPVAVIMGFLLHYLPAPEAAAVVAEYARLLPAGSYLVITIGRGDPGTRVEKFYTAYNADARRLYNHTHADFASFFADLEILPPGLGFAQEYEPGQPAIPPPSPNRVAECLVGIARVPPRP